MHRDYHPRLVIAEHTEMFITAHDPHPVYRRKGDIDRA